MQDLLFVIKVYIAYQKIGWYKEEFLLAHLLLFSFRFIHIIYNYLRMQKRKVGIAKNSEDDPEYNPTEKKYEYKRWSQE